MKMMIIFNIKVMMLSALMVNGLDEETNDGVTQCTVNAGKTTHGGKPTSFHVGNLFLSLGNRMNLLLRSNQEDQTVKLRGELGVNLPEEYGKPSFCRDSLHCLSWGGTDVKLIIKRTSSKCHSIIWRSETAEPLLDCFSFGTDNWFGGPENWNQIWPVEELDMFYQPYLPKEHQYMGIAEPYWLNSRGVYIYIDNKTPLFVDSNNYRPNSICFMAKDNPPYIPRSQIRMKYTICQFDDPRKAHEHALKTVLKTPLDLPDLTMIRHPIWSTWVRYQQKINETQTLDFAEKINAHGFNKSQIEIDDKWETCYGSTVFNASRFPDVRNMTTRLKDMGFRTTLWTHPFVNQKCDEYKELHKKGYFVKNHKGSSKTTWWNGEAGVVDFTDGEAAAWFKEKHLRLMNETGIDGFKFDAGEASWLPEIAVLNATFIIQPGVYTSSFVSAVAEFGKMSEVRVGYGTQNYPIFLRMLDKDSTWTHDNGLPTLITTLLVMNMAGYYWVLPDMVGGNGYDTEITKELFIRWLQANTFMPAIQFSVAPFDFDNETIEISKKFTSLHYEYSDTIIELMNISVNTGAPLNPPIWWIDPKNPTTYAINSQYLLGENILVAPIVEEDSVHRDIYLPKGVWRDENRPGVVYNGRHWLRDYPANLSTLPYFTRIKPDHRNETYKRDSFYADEETFF